MSFYEFLRDHSEDIIEGEEPVFTSENQEAAVLNLPALVFLAFISIFILLYICFSKKSVKAPEKPTVYTYNFHIRNFLSNPIITNVNFYQDDHVVPSD